MFNDERLGLFHRANPKTGEMLDELLAPFVLRLRRTRRSPWRRRTTRFSAPCHGRRRTARGFVRSAYGYRRGDEVKRGLGHTLLVVWLTVGVSFGRSDHVARCEGGHGRGDIGPRGGRLFQSRERSNTGLSARVIGIPIEKLLVGGFALAGEILLLLKANAVGALGFFPRGHGDSIDPRTLVRPIFVDRSGHRPVTPCPHSGIRRKQALVSWSGARITTPLGLPCAAA